jgi:lactate dehydrogenase-like 2-hydroxyacid dehydrogenase
MSQPLVLVTRRIPAPAFDRIAAACTVRHWDDDAPIPPAALRELAAGVAGIFCLITDRIDAAVLAAAGPSLRVVSTMSVGYDHIDIAACRAQGVTVGYTPGVLTETTAELALALLLATARRLPEAWSAVKEGAWGPWRPAWMTGADIFGSTVGIVGLGRIGAAVAQRLVGFGCRLLYSGSAPKPAVAGPVGAEFVDFSTLLAESDFVTIHCPLNAATHHLFDAAAFARMKRSAILINTSRGGVVDQEALYSALATGQIAAAGLDVTTPEPLPPDHPLLTLPNCVVLPHIGSASVATRTRMAVMAADNLVAGVTGQPLPNPVVT